MSVGFRLSASGQAAIIFSLAIGAASRNVRIGVLPKHHRPLMLALLVVAFDPGFEIPLRLGDGAIDSLAERDPVELVEHGLVETLDDAIGSRALLFIRESSMSSTAR